MVSRKHNYPYDVNEFQQPRKPLWCEYCDDFLDIPDSPEARVLHFEISHAPDLVDQTKTELERLNDSLLRINEFAEERRTRMKRDFDKLYKSQKKRLDDLQRQINEATKTSDKIIADAQQQASILRLDDFRKDVEELYDFATAPLWSVNKLRAKETLVILDRILARFNLVRPRHQTQ